MRDSQYGKRQKNQRQLAFGETGEGEARNPSPEGNEPPPAERSPERPAKATGLMEVMVSPENMKKALKRVMANAGGLASPTEAGTPQGGPLSPLLSNIYLDDLDHELERRGHSFVRYADDCNIYVQSERAGLRGRGLSTSLAAFAAGSPFSHWRMSASVGLNTTFPASFFADLGLISMEARCSA